MDVQVRYGIALNIELLYNSAGRYSANDLKVQMIIRLSSTAIKINSAWDSSHSLRFSLWLMSFMDANEINSEEYGYWRNLLCKLGEQFLSKVAVFTSDGVLLNNYMDGGNGLYRVMIIGDTGLIHSPILQLEVGGGGSILSDFYPGVPIFVDEFYDMVISTDSEEIEFRTLYYGERDYSMPVDETGLRSVDLLGSNTIYGLNCRYMLQDAP